MTQESPDHVWSRDESPGDALLLAFLLRTAGETVLKAFQSALVGIFCFFLTSRAVTLSGKEIRFV